MCADIPACPVDFGRMQCVFCTPPLFISMHMRKLFLSLLLVFPLALMSQSKFGYFSYSAVLDSLPEYGKAINDYNELKKRCSKEIERNESELTRFYVSFLDGQRDFPEPILRKRQKELQQMIDNSVVFRDQLKQWLKQAKDSLCRQSHQAIDSALSRVCREFALTHAIDTDEKVYKYVNPDFGVDITSDLISVILFPEKPLRRLVECAEDTADSITVSPHREAGFIATDPATFKAVKEAVAATDTIPLTEEKHYEVNDSVNNK